MYKKVTKALFLSLISMVLLSPTITSAQTTFNANHIISDEEMQNMSNWTQNDVQSFLDNKNSFLSTYRTVDVDGKYKKAADIIYDASKNYTINPKFLLVTLQKEQSLITDKTPGLSQLDWATGYAVCDSCATTDPKLQKYRGFGLQVDNAAGLIRWYYNNKNSSFVKKKDQTLNIDSQIVRPQSWATAFLYTYTPHIHGNKNFWNIWQEWFKQNYPNGTVLKSKSTEEIWLVQNGIRRKFKNKSVLLSRVDQNMIITVPDSELSNYKLGKEVAFPNYSILKSSKGYYLLDYDTLRPFASEAVIKKLGYNPQEIIEVATDDLNGLEIGKTITMSDFAPQGIIYQITDYNNSYYLIKDNNAYFVVDKKIVDTDYKNLAIEKHTLSDLKKFNVSDSPLQFKDGSLLSIKNSDKIYVIEDAKKRKFSDEKTFLTMGYKKDNVIEVDRLALLTMQTGEPIFYSTSVDVADLNKTTVKFLGDEITPVKDHYGTTLPAYIVAEYPIGKIISGKNIDVKRPVASFVKVFLGYEALQQGLDQKKTNAYSNKKYGEEGYSLWVGEGVKLTNKDLLNTMLVGSYNNFARMTAQATGLTEKQIIEKINTRMKEWGADNTNIADVTGLSEKNISTARDLLKIFTYSSKNSEITNILGKPRHDFASTDGRQGFIINHTNKLAFDNTNYKIISSKTGYTDEALSVLYLLIKSKKTNKKYVIITLGNSDYVNRFSEPNKIANWTALQGVSITKN